MATAASDAAPYLDDTRFSVTDVLDASLAVTRYAKRIGIHDRATARRFDGFHDPRYVGDTWMTPEEATERWQDDAEQLYLHGIDYTGYTRHGFPCCRITATASAPSDVDDTGSRVTDPFGVQGEVTIDAVLDPSTR